jgi:predicted metal-binding membrane protein
MEGYERHAQRPLRAFRVEGIEAPVAPGRGIEAALRNDRRVALGGLAAVVALAWFYLWRSAAGMDHASMAMSAMPRAVDASALVLTFVMWTVMMAGMMLPSAAPAILLYGALVRKNVARGTVLPGVWIFAAAYLLAWTGFSAAATLLQALLEAASLMTPAMTVASSGLSALALVAAGVYQLTPLKQTCLSKCRNPLEFFVTHWRADRGGAFRMGLEHGTYCVGCCWVLMLLLFVAGVMNLAWVALIAAFVFAEKLLPAGRLVSHSAGAVLILSGIWVLAGI